MVGSNLVSLPWAYANTGLALGIIIQTIAFFISYVTTYMIIKVAGSDIDFTDTL